MGKTVQKQPNLIFPQAKATKSDLPSRMSQRKSFSNVLTLKRTNSGPDLLFAKLKKAGINKEYLSIIEVISP